MGDYEGGRWDVAVKDDAVYVQRVSDDDEQLFEDSLAPDEARELAGLLTKFADEVDRSEDSDDFEDFDESDDDEDESDESDDDEESYDDDESHDDESHDDDSD